MDWVALLSDTWVARAFTRAPTLYIFASAAHILSIGMLFGSVLVLDLRLLNLRSLGFLRALPIAATASTLSRVAATGLAAAVATGFLLFLARPGEYLHNTAFLAKLALVAAGAANALLIRMLPGWRGIIDGREASLAVRMSAVLSLIAWISAILAGRWIGFL